jgi:hypothetical protein
MEVSLPNFCWVDLISYFVEGNKNNYAILTNMNYNDKLLKVLKKK